MIKKLTKRTAQAILGIIVTAMIGWCGSIIGDIWHWGFDVNHKIEANAEEYHILDQKQDLHWTSVNNVLNSMDKRLDHIENRLDNVTPSN